MAHLLRPFERQLAALLRPLSVVVHCTGGPHAVHVALLSSLCLVYAVVGGLATPHIKHTVRCW